MNATLAQRRAEATAGALAEILRDRGVADVVIDAVGAGEESTRFGERYPEARLLSRGVEIVAEQSAP